MSQVQEVVHQAVIEPPRSSRVANVFASKWACSCGEAAGVGTSVSPQVARTRALAEWEAHQASETR